MVEEQEHARLQPKCKKCHSQKEKRCAPGEGWLRGTEEGRREAKKGGGEQAVSWGERMTSTLFIIHPSPSSTPETVTRECRLPQHHVIEPTSTESKAAHIHEVVGERCAGNKKKEGVRDVLVVWVVG